MEEKDIVQLEECRDLQFLGGEEDDEMDRGTGESYL